MCRISMELDNCLFKCGVNLMVIDARLEEGIRVSRASLCLLIKYKITSSLVVYDYWNDSFLEWYNSCFSLVALLMVHYVKWQLQPNN